VQIGSVAIATLAFATFPIITALIEPAIFREEFDWRNISAALAAFVGVAIIAQPAGSGATLVGTLWGIAAAVSFAALSLLNRGRVRHYPGRVVAFYQNAGAAICTLPFALTTDASLTLSDVGLLLVLGVFCTALAHSLYIRSMKDISATAAGLVACLEPVYAILLAAAFAHEPLTWRVAVSAVLILGSSIFSSLVKKKR
jgi:drug/metabolite transporter (DMT)-like permease